MKFGVGARSTLSPHNVVAAMVLFDAIIWKENAVRPKPSMVEGKMGDREAFKDPWKLLSPTLPSTIDWEIKKLYLQQGCPVPARHW